MKKAAEFIALGSRLSQQEQALLESFSKRIQNLHDLNLALTTVASALGEFKSRKDPLRVQESTKKVRAIIAAGFAEALPPEISQDLLVEQKEVKELIQTRLHDFSQLRQEFLKGTEAEKKIARVLEEIRQEIQLEQKTADEIEHLKDALHAISLVHSELRAALKQLLAILNRADNTASPLDADALIYELSDLGRQIQLMLRKEREQIRHLEGLFAQKYSTELLLEKYRQKPRGIFSFFSRKKLIETKDVARDIAAILTEDELVRYTTAILEHADLLTPHAKRYLIEEGKQRAENLRKTLVTLTSEAAIDPLTKLYKVNIFQRRFNEEKSRADRERAKMSIAFIDIDKFKDFNTVYTHEVANEALVFVVETIRKALRKSDLFFRWGGEELVVLLPNTPKDGAAKVTEKVRAEVETKSRTLLARLNNQLEQQLRSRNVWDLRKINITVSAGVVEYPSEGNDSTALVAAASAKLNHAKESGRNKIVF